jgi:hypothetical protein
MIEIADRWNIDANAITFAACCGQSRLATDVVVLAA